MAAANLIGVNRGRVSESWKGADMSQSKSRLVALVFNDPHLGEEARVALHRMDGEGLLETDETALIAKYEDGRIRTSQDLKVLTNKKGGHIIGLFAAAISGTMPFVLTGVVGGRLLGSLLDNVVANKFIKSVTKEMGRCTSALIMIARSEPERREKVIEKLRKLKPKIIESDLPPDLEKELAESLQKSAAN